MCVKIVPVNTSPSERVIFCQLQQVLRKLGISLMVLTDLVEIKGEVTLHGAVEARLEERRPPVTEPVRSPSIVLAHSRHSRVYRLQK